MSTFNTTTNTTTTTTNFDNLHLQSLLNRLQIHPPPPQQPPPINPLLSSSFQDFLSQSFSDEDDDDFDMYSNNNDDDDDDDDSRKKTRVSKEESRLEKEIVKLILSGNTTSLKPNSGQAVSIGDHHICVGFHEDDCGSGYRVWEWHGHLMLFDDHFGYSPEYIYGNYFERLFSIKVEKKEGQNCNLGLKELIENHGGSTRVLHSSRNAGLSRVL